MNPDAWIVIVPDLLLVAAIATLLAIGVGLRRRLALLRAQWLVWRAERLERKLEHKRAAIEVDDPSRYTPTEILGHTAPVELVELRGVLDLDATADAEKIVTAIRSAGSHTLAIPYRWMQGKDPYVSYEEVAGDVLEKMYSRVRPQELLCDIERQLIDQGMIKVSENMKPEDKRAFLQEVEGVAASSGKNLATAGWTSAAHLAGNASGFGVYLAASTVVGAVSNVMGVTLPFAVYTSMSSTISLFLGPLGVALSLALLLTAIGAPNMKKTIMTVHLVALVRARLMKEREDRLGEVDKELRAVGEHINTYRRKIDAMQNTRASSHTRQHR